MRADLIEHMMRWHGISVGDIEMMRAIWTKTQSVVAVARWMAENLFDEGKMSGALQIAFHLRGADASSIGGWCCDGSGEISDERLQTFLNGPIEENVLKWQDIKEVSKQGG